MDISQARAILTALRERGAGILDPEVITALGVLLGPAQPAAPAPAPALAPASASGAVGFVGALRLPEHVWMSEDGDWVPYEEVEPALAWGRLLSWGGPGMVRPAEAGASWLQAYVRTVLRGAWNIAPIESEDTINLYLSRAIRLAVPAVPSMVHPVEIRGERCWEFRRGASTYDFLTLLAHAAITAGFPPEREVAAGEGDAVRVRLIAYTSSLGDAVRCTLSSVEAYLAWTQVLADRIRTAAGGATLYGKPIPKWDTLSTTSQEGWAFWIRNHPGMLRLELALRGFFANGGEEAVVSLCAYQDPSEVTPAAFMDAAFDAPVNRVCAPGLGAPWQAAVASWAGEHGATAVLEVPRYAVSEPPDHVHLGDTRWTEDETFYEAYPNAAASFSLEPVPDGVGPWLVVDNPLAMGSYDAQRLAPPSGHRAARPEGALDGVRGTAVE